jgi:hypothetical protein
MFTTRGVDGVDGVVGSVGVVKGGRVVEGPVGAVTVGGATTTIGSAGELDSDPQPASNIAAATRLNVYCFVIYMFIPY